MTSALRRLSRKLSAPALGSALLLVSACGWVSGGDTSTSPKGFERISTPAVSFAYPAGWSKLDNTNEPAGWRRVVGQRVDGSVAVGVTLNTSLRDTSDPQVAADLALSSSGYLPVAVPRKTDRQIEVRGAADARWVGYILDPPQDDSGAKISVQDIVMLDESGNVTVLRISGDQGKLTKATVSNIVDSITLKNRN